MSTNLIERITSLVEAGEASRSGLARAAGLHPNSLRKLGNADWNPTADTLGRLEKLLDGGVQDVLVGAETIRKDNPRLTVRRVAGARQPWRVVLTRSGRFPTKAKIFNDEFAERTLVFRDQPLAAVFTTLGEREITSVLIEGGGEVLGQALDARLVDRVQIYLAPLLTGGPVLAFPGRGAASTQQAARLRELEYERIGDDLFVTAKATYHELGSE